VTSSIAAFKAAMWVNRCIW